MEAEDDDFIKTIEEKLKLIKGVLDDWGVIAAFEEHIQAIKNLALALEDKENFDKFKASFEDIKNELFNVNSEELLTVLNSTLFEIKDELIEQINTLSKSEKIIENMEEFIPL